MGRNVQLSMDSTAPTGAVQTCQRILRHNAIEKWKRRLKDRLERMPSTDAVSRSAVTAGEWFKRIGMNKMGRAQDQGKLAESMALERLQRRGWRVLNQNWSCKWGELDLVLQKDRRLLVVEVKGRRAGHHDRNGLDAFHRNKRRRLARAISCWRSVHPEAEELLLQVILALVPLNPSQAGFRWIDVDRLS